MNGAPPAFRWRLPATSANLGPGFDALGLAISLYLSIEADLSDGFAIDASGRDAAVCGDLDDSLILATYREVLRDARSEAPPIHLRIENGIPLGMGCGSSAAALLAGVLLANHFGALGWSEQQVLDEACRREGHPDNVSACWMGGMTCSTVSEDGSVLTATLGEDLDWRGLLVLPRVGLATKCARALLPVSYSRADAVANVGATALLVAAFAQNRPDLLRAGTHDRMHQPYRGEACPLLPTLLPLAAEESVYSVTLSGAGPSVLLLYAARADQLAGLVQTRCEEPVELVEVTISRGARYFGLPGSFAAAQQRQ